MKELRLSLKKNWFEMTKAGIKKEDYREITPYWAKRLVGTWLYKYSKGINENSIYVDGIFTDFDRKTGPICPKPASDPRVHFQCNEIVLPNGDIIWQKAPVGGVLNVGDRVFDIEILTDKVVLLKFKEFFNLEYQNEFINRDFFDIRANTFFEERVNIDGIDKKVKLLKGQYPIYLSTNPEFKAIVKINAELVN